MSRLFIGLCTVALLGAWVQPAQAQSSATTEIARKHYELGEKLYQASAYSDALVEFEKAYKELALRGDEDDKTLIRAMARHPGLLNRPIGVRGRRALLGRPIERLLDL